MYLRLPPHEYMLTKSEVSHTDMQLRSHTTVCWSAARPFFCSILESKQSRVDLISLLSTRGARGSLLTLCERAAKLEPMPARKPTSARLRIVHTAESSETPLPYFSIPVEVSEEYGASEWPGLEQTGKGEGL